MKRSSRFAVIPGLALIGLGCAARVAPAPVPVGATPHRDRLAPGSTAFGSTAFVDVTVIPMDTERVLPHQTVVVQAGRIATIGPVASTGVPRGARRIDGRGKFLIPGLGDMHTHVGYSGTANAERHLLLALASGITTIRNMDWYPNAAIREGRPEFTHSTPLDGAALLRLKARTASGEVVGPRIYTSAPWRTDTTKSVEANVTAYKAAGYDHIKWYLEGDALTDSLAAAAHRVGIPLVGHGLEPVWGGLRRTLALGFTSIEHMVPYVNDSTLPAQVVATVRAGVWNCICPTKISRQDLHPSPLERRYALREIRALSGMKVETAMVSMYTKSPAAPSADQAQTPPSSEIVATALRNGGAKLLVGTDMPAVFLGFFVLPTTLHRNLQNLVRIGFTPYEVLRLATRNVAEYFGTLDSVGTVTVGKRADLVLLTGNPLEDIRHVSDIAGVMAAGRWLSQAELERRLDAYYNGAPAAGASRAGR